MKSGLGIIAVLLALALPAQAQHEPRTDAELLDFLHGCWSRVSWPAEIEAQRTTPGFAASNQMCLESSTGEMSFFNCIGVGMDCWETLVKYEIRDGQIRRDHGDNTSGGRVDVCDMTLEGGSLLTLHDCQWVDADRGVEPVEDIRYERIIDL